MKTVCCLCGCLAALAVAAAGAAEPGLVAHWAFDEGQGTVARDLSGGGSEGTIHDARWVKSATGACLEFDGERSWVDCGAPAALDLHGSLTLEAWVYPTGQPRGEPGILGKHFQSYLLTYYTDGNAWFYIGDGGNNTHAPLPVGTWTLVTATFDGRTEALYLDGKLRATHPSRFAEVPAGGRFTIGLVAGEATAADPAYRNTAHFEGLLDDVKVYNRALPAEQVAAHARVAAPQFRIVEDFRPAPPALSLRLPGGSVQLAATGQLQLALGADRYLLNSHLSYALAPGSEPATGAGYNSLATVVQGEEAWRPQVRRLSPTAAEVTARGSGYELSRRVQVRQGAVEIRDTVRSLTSQPLGLVARHELVAASCFAEAFSAGGAETPYLFVRSPASSLGVVMEDDLSRLRFEPRTALRANACSYRLPNLALAPGRALTFRHTLLPLPRGAGYWDLTNLLRRRWHSNYTVQGPLSWIDMQDPLLSDPAKLRACLQRKQVKVMLLCPWLDYDPGAHDRVWSRDEYRAAARQALDRLKAVQPDLQCLGCIECDWVTIYPEQIAEGAKLPVYGKGSGGLNEEQTAVLRRAKLPFLDSMKLAADGTATLELYSRGGKPQTALSVYPAPGNHQAAFLQEQVRFLLDDVGLDGFYIDEFSQGWGGSIRNYAAWDGVSAEVDPRTGALGRLYTDCSYAGIPVRVALVKYALDRGKTVVCNTYATAMAECGLPANRFSETWAQYDPMTTPSGEKPPPLTGFFRSNLGSPIGLGTLGHPEQHDTAQRLMKALIAYLRHGMVYYHYFLEDIPETGEGSGEYGPVNHMFPLTPVELGEGFIVARERTLTCVSGRYQWPHPRPPQVLVFDLQGRRVPAQPTVRRSASGYQVSLKLHDWAQFAVIE